MSLEVKNTEVAASGTSDKAKPKPKSKKVREMIDDIIERATSKEKVKSKSVPLLGVNVQTTAQPDNLIKRKNNSSVIESLESTSSDIPGINTSSRTRELVQYQTTGNDFTPMPNVKLVPKLEAGIYGVRSVVGGVVFEKKDIISDEILKFEDSRYNKVVNEVEKFWGLKSKFSEYGFTHKRGLLLYGPPGTGKSCLLKQIMDETISKGGVVFICKSTHSLMEGIKSFKDVEPTRNVLVILEDIDEFGEHSILQLFDGDDVVDGVCYLATTNYINRLPPRVLRVGRFDTKMEVRNPPAEGRRAYLRQKLKNETDERINELVNATDDFSFAQMREFLISLYCYGGDTSEIAEKVRTGITESTSKVSGISLKIDNAWYLRQNNNKGLLGPFEEGFAKNLSRLINTILDQDTFDGIFYESSNVIIHMDFDPSKWYVIQNENDTHMIGPFDHLTANKVVQVINLRYPNFVTLVNGNIAQRQAQSESKKVVHAQQFVEGTPSWIKSDTDLELWNQTVSNLEKIYNKHQVPYKEAVKNFRRHSTSKTTLVESIGQGILSQL